MTTSLTVGASSRVLWELPGGRPARRILRGRDSPLAAIGECLSAVLRGGSRVVLVEGPAGVGKTSLLAEAATMAIGAGVVPALGEAFETDRGIPFAPLAAALAEAGIAVGRLGGSPPGAPPDVHWMLHEFQGAMEDAASRTPLALLLDDLQWADSGTVAAIRDLPGRLSGTPVLWLLSMRTGELGPPARAVVRRLEAHGAHRMRLEGLAPEAVAAMIADRAGAEADPLLLDLAARARGNPFLVAELLDGLAEEGRLDVSTGRATLVGDALPRRLTDSMVERLDRLSSDARQAVRVASVLGARFSVRPPRRDPRATADRAARRPRGCGADGPVPG